MRIIAIANQKGGVGKSTTAINLSAGLVKHGKRTLLIDCDPQGHATVGLNIEADSIKTLADLLNDKDVSIEEVICNTHIEGLDVIPSDIGLSVAEMQLSTKGAKEFKLRNALHNIQGYDFIIIDCPPTFGTLTMNAFTTASEIILPVQLSYFSLQGVESFADTINFINNEIGAVVGHQVGITGVLLTFFDTRTRHSRSVFTNLQDIFEGLVFKTKIPQNVKLQEAQALGKSIFEYDPDSRGAEAYNDLTKEVLGIGKKTSKQKRKSIENLSTK